jgi:hypothetical protein
VRSPRPTGEELVDDGQVVAALLPHRLGRATPSKPARARAVVTSMSGLPPSDRRRNSFMMWRSSKTIDVFDCSTWSTRARSTSMSGAMWWSTWMARSGSNTAS